MIFQCWSSIFNHDITSERRWQRRIVSICHRWSDDENLYSQLRVSLCPTYLEYVWVNEHLRNFQVSNWILWLEIILQRKYLVPREKLWLRKDKMDWSPRRQLLVNIKTGKYSLVSETTIRRTLYFPSWRRRFIWWWQICRLALQSSTTLKSSSRKMFCNKTMYDAVQFCRCR